ncbi:MAG: hypothetical protein CL912_16680 [Deltaproteobacteria bacterium]|nr:hypothetical protein [Deltaproteobacteria bacterium]
MMLHDWEGEFPALFPVSPAHLQAFNSILFSSLLRRVSFKCILFPPYFTRHHHSLRFVSFDTQTLHRNSRDFLQHHHVSSHTINSN